MEPALVNKKPLRLQYLQFIDNIDKIVQRNQMTDTTMGVLINPNQLTVTDKV